MQNVGRAEEKGKATQRGEEVLKKRKHLKRGETSGARRGVLVVTGKVVGSYRVKRDEAFSKKLLVWNAG